MSRMFSAGLGEQNMVIEDVTTGTEIWVWDTTHFTNACRACFAIVDMVSRKRIDTLISVEETTQVRVIFEHALELEGLLELLADEGLDLDPRCPILLAVSDNGPPMTARATRA